MILDGSNHRISNNVYLTSITWTTKMKMGIIRSYYVEEKQHISKETQQCICMDLSAATIQINWCHSMTRPCKTDAAGLNKLHLQIHENGEWMTSTESSPCLWKTQSAYVLCCVPTYIWLLISDLTLIYTTVLPTVS